MPKLNMGEMLKILSGYQFIAYDKGMDFDLDMRFLYSPQQALTYRDKYDFRGAERVFCSYCGYSGEDLSDMVSFGNITAERIAEVSINGSSRGVFTEISVYRDKFPHS